MSTTARPIDAADPAERGSLASIPLILLVAAAIGWAGGQDGVEVGGLPLFAWSALLAFGINWAVFVPAYLLETERGFDLTGSLTYLSLVALALVFAAPDPRGVLLGLLVTVWAVRLGRFLFGRVRRAGSDRRFESIKRSARRFFVAWTLQGLWVLLTLSCALTSMTSLESRPLGFFALLGLTLWMVGFTIEVVADRQKSAFRADPANRDRFIASGLWAWSRHPNYFGEILLWTGIAVISLPSLQGWQHVTLISPVFVFTSC